MMIEKHNIYSTFDYFFFDRIDFVRVNKNKLMKINFKDNK
jgi:hypothetical protein